MQGLRVFLGMTAVYEAGTILVWLIVFLQLRQGLIDGRAWWRHRAILTGILATLGLGPVLIACGVFVLDPCSRCRRARVQSLAA